MSWSQLVPTERPVRSDNETAVAPSLLSADFSRLAEEIAAVDGVEVRFDPSPGIAPANVDPGDIHTCLANLVSNGIDACRDKDPEDGERSVTIRTSEAGGVVILEVADTGCGMNRKTKNKVFNTFFTTKGLEGTGLGLLVTRKLAAAHGGGVGVDSVEGEGSVFRIELPREKLPAVSSSQTEGDGKEM